MFKFIGTSKGVPQPTDLYFNYFNSGWTLIGSFKSKYAAQLYAYDHGHMRTTYEQTWKIESTSYTEAKKQFEDTQVARYRGWVACNWYQFYTEKYGEDYLK